MYVLEDCQDYVGIKLFNSFDKKSKLFILEHLFIEVLFTYTYILL